jgi:hypothetical protein
MRLGALVTGIEVAVVGYLAAWGLRKLRRVGAAVDAEVDRVIDAALEEMHDVIAGKLGGDPALQKLEAAPEQVPDRVRQRVELAIADAVEDDPGFAVALARAVDAVRQAEQASGVRLVSAADGGFAAGGDVNITAPGGVAAGTVHGGVTLGYSPRLAGHVEGEDPSLPGRSAG